MAFVLASNEVFGLIVNRLSFKRQSVNRLGVNPGQVGVAQSLQAKRKDESKSVARRAKALKQIMVVVLFVVHILFLVCVLLSSLWTMNVPGICNARSSDKDARQVVEMVRFYIVDAVGVVVTMFLWTNIHVFTGAARRKKKRGTTQVAPPTGCMNATSVALTNVVT
jgi:hypothetical protein